MAGRLEAIRTRHRVAYEGNCDACDLLIEIDRLRAALEDLLELHEDEPDRPSVKRARKALDHAE